MTSQSRAIRSLSRKIVKCVKFELLIFCDLTDVPASIYDRKMDTRFFDTIQDIRYLSFVQSLLRGRNTSILREREPTHMRLSGTDRLSQIRKNDLLDKSENFRVKGLIAVIPGQIFSSDWRYITYSHTGYRCCNQPPVLVQYWYPNPPDRFVLSLMLRFSLAPNWRSGVNQD